jgi:hypothetical protein
MSKHLSATLLMLVAMAVPSLAQTLVSIQAVPPIMAGFTGDQDTVQVVGTYSDGSQQDVTSQAAWTSDSPAVTVSNTAPQITVNPVIRQEAATLTAIVSTPPALLSTTIEFTVLTGSNYAGPLPPGSVRIRGGNEGVSPFSAFAGGPVDSLNKSTSNVLVNIPVRTKNETIPFSFSLLGNFSAQAVKVNATQYAWVVASGVQPVFGGMLTDNVTYLIDDTFKCDNIYDERYSGFGIVDGTGAVHPVPGIPYMDAGVYVNGTVHHCYPTTHTSVANDNSGLTLTYNTSGTGHQWTITDTDGHTVVPDAPTGHTLTDIDGNQTYFKPTHTGYSIVDSENTTVLTAVLGNVSNGSVDKYQYTDYSGTTQTFSLTLGRVYSINSLRLWSSGVLKWYWTVLLAAHCNDAYISR